MPLETSGERLRRTIFPSRMTANMIMPIIPKKSGTIKENRRTARPAPLPGHGAEVPDKMERHGQAQADNGREKFNDGVLGFASNAEADAGHAGEERVRERRENSTQNQDAAEVSAGFELVGIVFNIFGHRKAERDHSGVDDAIDDAIKIGFAPRRRK